MEDTWPFVLKPGSEALTALKALQQVIRLVGMIQAKRHHSLQDHIQRSHQTVVLIELLGIDPPHDLLDLGKEVLRTGNTRPGLQAQTPSLSDQLESDHHT